MAGHNKWSKIKRLKGENDVNRAKTFGKISSQIIAGIRACNGETDPSLNIYLSSALNLAKQAQMPKANVEQAIKKATCPQSGNQQDLETIIYEGLGPGHISCLVETLTANRNKTFNEIRHLFTKFGSLSSVSYLFERHGYVYVDSVVDNIMEDALSTNLVIDINEIEGTCSEHKILELISHISDTLKVQKKMESLGHKVLNSEIRFEPKDARIPLKDEQLQSDFVDFIDKLENLDDVIRVYHNARL